MNKTFQQDNIVNHNKKTKKAKIQIVRDAALPGGGVWALRFRRHFLRSFLKRASDSCSKYVQQEEE